MQVIASSVGKHYNEKHCIVQKTYTISFLLLKSVKASPIVSCLKCCWLGSSDTFNAKSDSIWAKLFAWLCMFQICYQLANRQQFPITSTLMDHGNDVRMFKTQVVLMQSFEHFDVIYMIDKSRDHGILSSIFIFYFSIDSFWRPFLLKFLGRWCWAREKEENKSRRHEVISIVCTVIDHSFDQVALEKSNFFW